MKTPNKAAALNAANASRLDSGHHRRGVGEQGRSAALHFMKTPRIILFALLLVGCTSTHQTASLTADQAKAVAIRLANEKAAATYHSQPFHDGQPPSFVAGHWIWTQLGTGDIEATVELAADGSTNSVTINQLVDKVILP